MRITPQHDLGKFLLRRACVFAALLCWCLIPVMAYAESDIFQIDSSQWKSLDHYREADRRGLLAASPTAAEPDQAANPAATAATQPTVMAVPTRPINLPVLPALNSTLNKGFEVKINSTEDADPPPPLAAAAHEDLPIADKNWQTPERAAADQSAAADADAPPLKVRLSFLPDSKITPASVAQHDGAQHKARLAMEQGLQPPPAPDKKNKPQICAAIDAYKKQQLNAIQSDRETLKALQEAIATLGLQKQLGFITGANSPLSAAQNASPGLDTDTPVAATVR